MHIEFVEISNFRKLISTRVGLSKATTVFVGANNSGKTSAITALRYFLVQREKSNFAFNDFTLSHWPTINAMGLAWEQALAAGEPLPDPNWDVVLPSVDVWLEVPETELHYVQPLLPSLEWVAGLLGVRVRYEPIDAKQLQMDYLSARGDVLALQKEAAAVAGGEGRQHLRLRSIYGLKIWSIFSSGGSRATSRTGTMYWILLPSLIQCTG